MLPMAGKGDLDKHICRSMVIGCHAPVYCLHHHEFGAASVVVSPQSWWSFILMGRFQAIWACFEVHTSSLVLEL